MSVRVALWRPLVGAAALCAALGLSLLTAPAQAAPAPARALAAAAPTATAASALPVLSRGSTGRYVRYVQRTLGLKVTGVFGARTARAVKAFQKSVALPVTGRVDLPTWKALKRKARADAASRGATAGAPPAEDPTMASVMRSSQAARSGLAFEVWLTSAKGRAIVRRESGGRCTAVNPSGAYRGKWQMGSWFWKNYGGLKYAATPDKASCLEQDRVAYKGWVDSWWNPWGG